MSAPKVGDRVRVEFEGRVQDLSIDGRLYINDGLPGDLVQSVHSRHCTVIAPPVEVGDIVTAENVDQLPLHSIVARHQGAPWNKVNSNLWRTWTRGEMGNLGFARDGGYVVLRIGGGAA